MFQPQPGHEVYKIDLHICKDCCRNGDMMTAQQGAAAAKVYMRITQRHMCKLLLPSLCSHEQQSNSQYNVSQLIAVSNLHSLQAKMADDASCDGGLYRIGLRTS